MRTWLAALYLLASLRASGGNPGLESQRLQIDHYKLGAVRLIDRPYETVPSAAASPFNRLQSSKVLAAALVPQTPARGIVAGSAGFTAYTAVFDGANDYITQSAAPTGLANAKTFTCSFWIKFNGGDGSNQAIFSILDGGSLKLQIQRWTDNKLYLFGRNVGGSTILDLGGSSTITSASGWVHVFICIDLANTSNRKIYLNGVAETLTVTTYTNDTLFLATPAGPYRIGAESGGASKVNAAYAEFWFDDTYNDIPTSFASGGHPVDIGATGSTPTGSAPVFYFSRNGSGDSWATDSSGNSNTMTVTGALGSTTAP